MASPPTSSRLTVEPGDRPAPTGTACLPKVFFLGLLLLMTALAAIEIRSRMDRPSIMRRDGEGAEPDLVFYQKGPPARRVAWILCEPGGKGAAPRVVQRVPCSPGDTETGEIRWTADGRGVYADKRVPARRGKAPEILWLHTFADGRLFISDESFALKGATAILQTPEGLLAQWKRMGGAGKTVASWYELGAQGETLWSWQTTRWERALPD